MLGDGGLYLNPTLAAFDMSLSDKKIPVRDFIPYLAFIREAFETLGVQFCEGHPKVGWVRGYSRCRLTSHVGHFLTAQHLRWYFQDDSIGVRDVPKDHELTPMSLAHFYMQDGCLSIQRGKNRKGGDRKPLVTMNLSSYNFSVNGIIILERQLADLDVRTYREYRKGLKSGSGIRLWVRMGSILDFYRLVKPYMMEPFMYKVALPPFCAWEDQAGVQELLIPEEFNSLRARLGSSNSHA